MFHSRLTVIAFIALLSGCGENPVRNAAAPLPSPTAVGLQTPTTGVYLGAYVSSTSGGLPPLEQKIGRTLALDAHYYTWVSDFPKLPENADVENGRYPVESWDCGIPNAQLASGAADPLIVTRAQAFRAFGHPFFMRFFWDENLTSSSALPYSAAARSACYDPATDNPDGTFSAKEFVAAWIHVRSIFAAQGVTNAIWVWSFRSAQTGVVDPSAYYPGASQVDWIGVDTYPEGGVDFPTLFDPIYTFASQYGKPIMISETGALPYSQSAYLGGVSADLQKNTGVKAFMYFDFSTWALQPAGSKAFTTLSQDPYMQALGTP